MDPDGRARVAEVETRLDGIETKIDRVLVYLDNDPGTGREGLYALTIRNTKDIARLDDEVKEIKTKGLVDKLMWGGAGGGVIAFVMKLIEKLS
jgi:hypothetical protein